MKTKFGNFHLDRGYWKHNVTSKALHRYIWEDFYGCEIPEGYVIHHKDRNPANNCILNLQLLPRSEHIRIHHKGKNPSKETRENMSKARKGVLVYPENHITWASRRNNQFSIVMRGKKTKYGINIFELVDWFITNYPNEDLELDMPLFNEFLENIPEKKGMHIIKDGFSKGKQRYGLVDGDYNVICHSVNYDKLAQMMEEIG